MSSSAAETVANIEELLTRILVSLPPRPLIHFKCVSKHWLTLISDPGLLRRNAQQTLKISGFFSSKTEDKSFKSIPLSNKDVIPSRNPFKIINDSFRDDSTLKIIQSCNGLFLCLRYYWNPRNIPGYVVNDTVYVVNPTTNEFFPLSCPRPQFMKALYMVRYALAFEPSLSPYYKVVCITTFMAGRDHTIDIYSSETQEWKELPCVPFFSSPSENHMHFDGRSREGAVYCKGKVHWIRCVSNNQHAISAPFPFSCIHLKNGRFVRDEGDVLHYFDMNEQSLRLVAATPPVTEGVKSQVVHRYFGESGGHLHLIEFFKHYDTQFNIMEMEEDYSGWFLKYYVDLNRVINPLPRRKFVVLFISRGEEKDDKVDDDESSSEDDDDDDSSAHLWLHVPGKVISYNIMKRTFETSAKFSNRSLFLGFDDNPYFRDDENCPYMETLASL